MRSLLIRIARPSRPPLTGRSLRARCARLFGVTLSLATTVAASGGAPRHLGAARRWRYVLGLCGFLLAADVQAQTIKILVQSSPLAGFQYHEATAVWDELKPGDALTLVREPENPHDANAVRVEWHGRMLGYLPRAENRSVAAEMDRGTVVSARIAKLREHRNPWLRVLVEVFVVL
jgi:hypothetical protein